MDVDIEQHRGALGRVADPLVERGGVDLLVIGAEMGFDLPEVGRLQDVQAVDEVAFEEEIAGDEQHRQRQGRRQGVPQGQPGADRLQRNW